MVVIKRQSRLLYESANILCWFRIITSVILAMMTRKHIVYAIWFTLAFLSDALDGWYYRKYAKDRPYQHWFNRLPITMDPLADFCLVIGGIIHIMDNKPMGLLVSVIVATIILIWQWLGSRASNQMFTILMTTLTYFWFILMVLSVVGVWYRNCSNSDWMIGFGVSMVIFYAIWLATRVKSRTVRRRG